MNRLFACLLVVGLFVIAVSSASVRAPNFPTQYEALVHMQLPYAKINEPIMTWYDGINNRQRMDYYGGMDSYIFRGDLNLTFQLSPTGVNQSTCFNTSGPVGLQSVFPDLTKFNFSSANVSVRGVACNTWSYVEQQFSRTNYYNFYSDIASGAPVQYEMFGYDTLFGSHYDEYVVIYDSVIPGVNPNAFDAPVDRVCTFINGSSGPSYSGAYNPMHELAVLHPYSESRACLDDHVHGLFENFMETHKKSYESDVEKNQRKQVFINNMRFVNSKNRQGLTYKLRLNQMADLTSEERTGRNPMKRTMNAAPLVHTGSMSRAELPDSIDWRDMGAVTRVKDQGVCGSCWSFATSETLEGSLFLKSGVLTELSPQALVDCSWPYGNLGCGGGQDFLAYEWVMSAGGIPSEAEYPYIMVNGYCTFDPSMAAAKIASYVNVTSYDETALMDAVVTSGPISISIDASQDSLSFYSEGVYVEPACKNHVEDLDHAVLLVGYGTDPTGGDYWIVKNSWSTHWGMDGYVLMSRANNMCGVETSPTYAILE